MIIKREMDQKEKPCFLSASLNLRLKPLRLQRPLAAEMGNSTWGFQVERVCIKIFMFLDQSWPVKPKKLN